MPPPRPSEETAIDGKADFARARCFTGCFINIARSKKFGAEDETHFLEIKSVLVQELERILAGMEVSSPTKEVVLGFDRPFVIIGERINPTGRKQLAAEMAAGNFDTVIADTIDPAAPVTRNVESGPRARASSRSAGCSASATSRGSRPPNGRRASWAPWRTGRWWRRRSA